MKQGLNQESTSLTTESQNLNDEASSTPKGQSTSQVPSRVGSSGDLIDGTDRNDIIVGLEGADIISGNGGSDDMTLYWILFQKSLIIMN